MIVWLTSLFLLSLKPKLEQYLTKTIGSRTSGTQVHIVPQSIKITLLPLGVHLHQVEFGLKNQPKNIYIEKLSLIPNFQFRKSNLRLIKVIASEANIPIKLSESKRNIKKSSTSYRKKYLEFFAEKLPKYLAATPIASITFEKSKIEIIQGHNKLTADIFLKAQHRFRSIDFDISSKFDLTIQKLNLNLDNTNLLSTFSVFKNRLYIENLSVSKDTVLHANVFGEVNNANDNQILESNLELELDSNLEIIRDILLKTNRIEKLPKLDGHIKSNISFGNDIEGTYWSFNNDFEGLSINDKNLGKLNITGTRINDKLNIRRARLQNNGADLRTTFIDANQEGTLKFNLNIHSLSLKPFLTNLKIYAPINGSVVGNLECELRYYNFITTCQASSLMLTNFIATNNQGTIISLDNTQLLGSLSLDKEKIEIDSTIDIGGNRLDTNGTVNFKTGFDFSYNSEALDVKALKNNISGLKLEGIVSGLGEIKGNSKTATFNIDLNVKDFWLEDYLLNNAKLDFFYSNKTLFFNNIDGSIGTSKYNADVRIDLEDQSISLEGDIPEFETSELISVFDRIVKLPFDSFGKGKAKINIDGPLLFNRLNYTLTSSIKNAVISGEYFDEVTFNIKATDGNVETEQVELKKRNGLVKLTGTGNPDGNIDLVAVGNNFMLENSQFLKKTNLKLSGKNSFRLTMKGHVLSPETRLNGNVENIRSYNKIIPSINYSMQLTGNNVSLSLNTSDESLKVFSNIPYSNQLPFDLNLQADRWNFAPYLSIFGADISRHTAFITANVDIKSSSDWLWNANGKIDILDMKIGKASKELVTKNSTITFNKGTANGIIEMIGNDNSDKLTFRSNNSRRNLLNMSVAGSVDLDLFSFLTPFLDNIRGTLDVACSIRGQQGDIRLDGFGAIKNGFLNVEHIPHPVENLAGRISFSKNQINIDRASADFASGTANAKGNIAIIGLKNFPAQIDLQLQNVKLNIPEGIETRGDANVKISGSWFPFLFEGTYDTKSVRFVAEFDDSETNEQYSSHVFLPKSYRERLVGPIQMNILSEFKEDAIINNSMVEGDFTGKLYIKGQPAFPRLEGRVDLARDSIIKVNNNEFTVNIARLDFKGGFEINPDIYLEAVTSFKEHTITMYVRGDVEEPDISFTSNTNLGHFDIVNLLAVGDITDETDNIDIETKIQSQALNVSTSLISQNILNKVLKEKTGVDFRLSTDMEETGEENVIEPTPKIVLKKQWNDKISTILSRRLGNSQTSDMRVEYKLSNKLSITGNYEELAPEESDTNLLSQDERDNNVLGLDLKYQVYFK